ncbi:MAG: glycosyltransferase family 4 protein [Solirubrobacterales bacterium]|nr:glycosyltransferase family 4 protein [Solirubrobacterales bacterium]
MEAYVEELCGALWESGRVDRVTVVTSRLPGGDAAERAPSGTTVFRYPAADVITNFPLPMPSRGLGRSLRAAGKPRPDVVIGNTRFFPASLLALAQSRGLGVPYVHIEHGSDYVQLDNPAVAAVARGYDRTIGRTVLRQADHVIAISEAARGFVAELARRSVPVVYRGLPLSALAQTPAAPDAERLATGRPILVYAGRLIDGKGVRDLVEAVSRLEPAVLCVMLGDGPRREDLEQQAREHAVEDRFAFLGYRPEEEVVAWMKAADVVVNPSYTEGLPTSVLLAAACQRAVVATDVGGTREATPDGEAALLVPPRDPAALAAALQRVLDDPGLRARLAAAGFERVRGRFDWQRCVESLLALSSDRVPRAGAPH